MSFLIALYILGLKIKKMQNSELDTWTGWWAPYPLPLGIFDVYHITEAQGMYLAQV
jgi:hypothetical protein